MKTPFPKGIAQPAWRALIGAGYSHLEELANVRKADLLKLHGMGPKAIRVLEDTLSLEGLSFKE